MAEDGYSSHRASAHPHTCYHTIDHFPRHIKSYHITLCHIILLSVFACMSALSYFILIYFISFYSILFASAVEVVQSDCRLSINYTCLFLISYMHLTVYIMPASTAVEHKICWAPSHLISSHAMRYQTLTQVLNSWSSSAVHCNFNFSFFFSFLNISRAQRLATRIFKDELMKSVSSSAR